MSSSNWPALRSVQTERVRTIEARDHQFGGERGHHPVRDGSPPFAKGTYFAAMIQQKALRIWNNVINGGDASSLRDSLIDIANYADFFSAMLLDETDTLGDLGKPSERMFSVIPCPDIMEHESHKVVAGRCVE